MQTTQCSVTVLCAGHATQEPRRNDLHRKHLETAMIGWTRKSTEGGEMSKVGVRETKVRVDRDVQGGG